MIDAAEGLFTRQIWRPALNELFHCGPYEVKASKFLSFFALAASLPFNQPSRRQKMAPPSAFKHSLRQVSGFFGSGGGGTGSPELGLPSSSRRGRGSSDASFSQAPGCCQLILGICRQLPPTHIRSRGAREDLDLSLGEAPASTALQSAG